MKLEGYEQLELLGEGRLGKTYRAIKKDSESEVRLKFYVIPENCDENCQNELKKEFFKRCITLKKLENHQPLDPIHAGRTDDFFFFESGFLKLKPFIELLSDRPQRTRENIIAYMEAIARKAKIYHDAGLVHGNIRISNIFIDDTSESLHLADAASSVFYDYFLEHDLPGNRDERYLPPELITDDRKMGPLDDFFGISVLFYRCLVGRYPSFQQKNSFSSMPQFAKPTDKKPELNHAVDEFFLKAFAKDPSQRYQNYDEFHEALMKLDEKGLIRQDICEDRADEDTDNLVKNLLCEDTTKKSRKLLWTIFILLSIFLIFAGSYLFLPEQIKKDILKFIQPAEKEIVTEKPAVTPTPGVETEKATPGEKIPTTLQVTTNPEEVNVFLNYSFFGKTPLDASDVTIGVNTFVFHLPGYLSNRVDINVAANQQNTIHIDLIKNPIPYSVFNSSGWPTFLHNIHHTGHTKQAVAENPTLLWHKADTGKIIASPVIYDSKIFVPTVENFVSIVDLKSGKVLEKLEGSTGCRASPFISEQHLFVPGDDGAVRAFDLKKFKEKGEAKTQSLIQSSLIKGRDTLFVVTALGGVHALDASVKSFRRVALKSLWTQELGERISATPVLFENSILLVNSARNLHALSVSDGSFLWHYLPTEQGDAAKDFDDSRITIADFDGPDASPCLCGKFVVYGSRDGWLYALSADKGKNKWKQQLDGAIFATPTCSKGILFAATDKGTVYAFDAISGQIIYQISCSSAIYASPIIADSRLIIVTKEGKVFIYHVDTGKEIINFSIDGTVLTTPVISENIVLFSTEKNGLMAYR